MQRDSSRENGLADRYVLCLTGADPHRNAAGLEKYLSDAAALLEARGISTVYLFPFPTRKSRWLNRYLSRFWGVIVNGMLQGFYDASGVMGLLAEWQRAGQTPVEIQIHHLLHLDVTRVADLLRAIPIDVRLFLHDFITICPQYNLLRNSRVYCGDAPPSAEKCGGCSWWDPSYHGRVQAVLDAAGDHLTVVAPSVSAQKIWVSAFPEYESQTEVVPHLISVGKVENIRRERAGNAPLRMAFVGAPAAHKGWAVFSRLVEELVPANPEYEFYHFGRPARIRGPVLQYPVSFLRDGPAAMTNAIQKANIDMVLLWSIWPETYSYTLQESQMAGAMILTNPDSGYLKDSRRVRCDIDEIQRRHSNSSIRLEANPAIANAIAAKPVPSLQIKGAGTHYCRHVTALYTLKRLKRKGWNGGV